MERRGAAPPCKCSGKTRDRAAQKSVGVVFCWVTEDEIKFDKNDPFGDTIGERMGKRGGGGGGGGECAALSCEVQRDGIKAGRIAVVQCCSGGDGVDVEC